MRGGVGRQASSEGGAPPPCPRGFAESGRALRRLSPVPLAGASASRRRNAGAQAGAGRETGTRHPPTHPPSPPLTAPRAEAGCSLRPRLARRTAGRVAAGGGAAELGLGEGCPPREGQC